MAKDELVPSIGQPPRLELSLRDRQRARTAREEHVRNKPEPQKISGYMDGTESMIRTWERLTGTIHTAFQRAGELGAVSSVQWSVYRDYDDGADVLKSSPWTTDWTELQRHVSAVRCFGGAGGTDPGRPEAVELALRHAVQSQPNIVILIGDAPPHSESDWLQSVRLLAHAKTRVFPFLVETIKDRDLLEASRIFKQIAEQTGGIFHVLNNDPQDLVDVLAMTALSSRGLGPLLQYAERYKLTSSTKEFADRLRLPPPPRGV